MTDVKIEIDDIFQGEIYFNWGGQGIGFGQLSVSKQAGKFICKNECMSRQQVRELLIAYANKLADIVELEDDNESTKGFERIPPIIKGVYYVTKSFSVFVEGMYVLHDGGSIIDECGIKVKIVPEMMENLLFVRGYKTAQEMIAENNKSFNV